MSSNTDILPRLSDDGGQPFVVEGEQSSHLAGVLFSTFHSYYQGKDSPPLNSQNPLEESEDQEPPTLKVESVIERAPESARLLVFASNDFVADQTLGLVGSAQGVENRNGVQLLMNAVDWSLEDQNLTSISARGAFNRTLPPLAPEQQRVIEVVNYAFAVVLIAALVVGYRLNTRRRRVRYQRWLDASADKAVVWEGSHEQINSYIECARRRPSFVGGVGLVWAQRWRRQYVPLRLVEFAPASVAKLTLADGTQNVELTKDAAGWQVQAGGYVRTGRRRAN